MPVIEINYTKEGIKIEVNGMQGAGCLRYTQSMLEHHSGNDGGKITTTLKPEFHEESMTNTYDATILCG